MDQRQAMSTMLASAFLRSKELKNRILFLLGAIIIARVGTHIPLVGVDAVALEAYSNTLSGGLLGVFNTFSGGALERMSIFVLFVFPYISASIVMMVARFSIPYLSELAKDGSKGRAVIEQYTKYLALVISFAQGFGVAKVLQAQQVNGNGEVLNLVADQSLMFPLHTALTIAASTMFLTWLGNRITEKGLYQGMSVLIFINIIASAPSAFSQLIEMNQIGTVTGFGILAIVAWIVGILAFCCFVESSFRKLVLKNPRALSQARQGNVDFSNESYLPYKVNSPGVMPVIFGSVVMTGLLSLFAMFPESEIAVQMASVFAQGSIANAIVYSAVIIVFSFVMAAAMYDTNQQAENLRKNGDFIPGLRPGKPTQEYLDFVLTRLTFIGAMYLVAVCVTPELIGFGSNLALLFSGTGVLIIVSVIMGIFDDVKRHVKEQIQSELMSRHSLRKGPRRKVQR